MRVFTLLLLVAGACDAKRSRAHLCAKSNPGLDLWLQDHKVCVCSHSRWDWAEACLFAQAVQFPQQAPPDLSYLSFITQARTG